MPRRTVTALLLLGAAAGASGAQEVPRFPSVMAALPADTSAASSALPVPITQRPWVRPVSSLVIPGSGQLMGGQARGIVYLAVEIWLISRAIAYDHRGDDQAEHYKQLAYDVARQQFSPSRVDGAFDYYESMEKFVESGVYDLDPSGAFLPEQDSTTYNGSIWQLARNTFFEDPANPPPTNSTPYLKALEFYQLKAVGGEFRWSWRGARLEQDVFRGAIRASDDAYRQRTNYLGVLVLNHLASAIDAMISARAGRAAAAIPKMTFETGPDRASLVWTGRF